MSSPQLRYWKIMNQLRVDMIYLHAYAVRYKRLDRGINIVAAIASSTSIGAWAIWKKYPLFWACIIACSQVAMIIKPVFLYEERFKKVCELNDEIQKILLEAESYWYDIAEGKISDPEIQKLYIELNRKSINAEQRIFKYMPLPVSKWLQRKAQKDADEYFADYYSLNKSEASIEND